MNEFDKLSAQLGTLARRVQILEASVRPLTTLQGIDGALISDQAVVSFAAEGIGSTLETVCGTSRTREATATRRTVAQLLRDRALWPDARIARALNRTESGVRRLLSGKN